ncbi:unnamed protein product [Calicophoron daubneyi]|uniref:Clathrin light chain n=1 Tax=Calicophoron daubneyi TaxID=300641 RepID=A0AAV2TX67_CALDB
MSTVDPVNAFLRREREELGDLSSELDVHGESSADAGDFAANHVQHDPGPYVPSNSCEDEPECIKKWSAEFNERLRAKDSDEEQKIGAMEEQGLKDLNGWAVQYRDTLARAIKNSRAHDKELRDEQNQLASASLAISNADASCPALWERVCNLCNFTNLSLEDGVGSSPAKTNESYLPKDLNRMRVLLLQLKQNPPAFSRPVKSG